MNEVIRQLYRRKSIRVYTDQPIGKAEKDAILRAAAEAPTAGNQQLYTILDITDQSIKEKLLIFPDETVVYPGHDRASSIGDERLNNLYLR